MRQSPLNDFIDFKGRTVIVTGSTGVVGHGIARRFAAAGALVYLHYRSAEAIAKALAQTIKTDAGQAQIVQADLSKQEEVAAMFTQIAEQTDTVDVLINNAGNYPVSNIVDMDVEEWDAVIELNMRSTFLCTQAVIKYMQQAGAGSIINISSIESQNPTPKHSHYTAAKAGVNMFTRTAANELGQYNIRCNAVLPGLIWREDIEEQWPEGVAAWLQAAPLKRLGLAEDVANACVFLSSDAANWITGAELRVDGGVLSNQAF